MAWYFECPIQWFSAAFDVLIKISESYRPQNPSGGICPSENRTREMSVGNNFEFILYLRYKLEIYERMRLKEMEMEMIAK